MFVCRQSQRIVELFNHIAASPLIYFSNLSSETRFELELYHMFGQTAEAKRVLPICCIPATSL
ncbi:hypothetical protein AKJ16_DCAP23763 [Drosera capensis]